jgi:hypothetical protein
MDPSEARPPGIEAPKRRSAESVARLQVRSWRKTDIRIFSSGSDAPRVIAARNDATD